MRLIATILFALLAPLSSLAAADQPDVVRLGYFANVTHAQAVLGVDSGDFQTAIAPSKLQTKVFNAGPELIQALNAGAIDIGYVGPGPVLSTWASSHGESVRVISGSAANGVVIVARKDSGIKTLADLKGKTIATPQYANTQDISARHYMTAVLGQADSENVKGIPNAQQAGMMALGRIDAAWVPEPWGSALIKQVGAILIGEEKDLWPDHRFALTVVVTSPKFLAEHPDVIEKILAVHHQWTLRLTKSPADYQQQLNAALAKLTGKKLPPEVIQGAISRTEFTDDALESTFTTMQQWQVDLKFAQHKPALTDLFQTNIIEKLAAKN